MKCYLKVAVEQQQLLKCRGLEMVVKTVLKHHCSLRVEQGFLCQVRGVKLGCWC